MSIILLMSIKLYERVNRFREDFYRNPFRYGGTLVGFGLGMYGTKDTDNFVFILAGVFLPAVLGNVIGGYIDGVRRG